MDWIRENKTAATIIGVAFGGGLALSGLLYVAYTDYDKSLTGFNKLAGDIAIMEKASLYPSEANVKIKADGVAAYQVEVGELGQKLLDLQNLNKDPSAKEVTDTDFQAKLKQRILDTKAKAQATTALPKDFALGFDTYMGALPKSAQAAKELNDYLDGVDAVITAAIDSGAKSIESLSRSELEVEKGLPPPPRTPPPPKKAPKKTKGKAVARAEVKPAVEVAEVVEKRQIILRLKLDQGPLQRFINTLASPGKMPHFTVIRVLRVENEKQEGPLIGALEEKKEKEATSHPVAGEPTVAVVPVGGPTTAPKAEVIRPATPEAYDAFAVLGQESLTAYFEIDLVRFVEPSVVEASTN